MKVKEIIEACESEWIPNSTYGTDRPKVTVILPTYNRATDELLKKAIESVLNQTYQELELIVIDDGSTDETFELCLEYMKHDSRISLIRHRYNTGIPAVGIYEGYKKSRGKFVAFIFDDNHWERDAVRKTILYMEEKGIRATYGITRVKEPFSDRTKKMEYNEDSINETCWLGNKIGNASVVLQREVIEEVGLFDPHLLLLRDCDWDLWMRITEHYRFNASGIVFATDNGQELAESINHGFRKNPWALREHQQHRNQQNLLPEFYEEIDVAEFSENSSRNYMNILADTYGCFEDKKWFRREEHTDITEAQPSDFHRYGLMICPAVTASIMNFTRSSNELLTFAYCSPYQLSSTMLAYAHFIVIVRDLSFSHIVEVSKLLRIPCYYYVDDNFQKLDKSESRQARLTTKKTLEFYSGVIVSSQALKDYFVEQGLHSNVYVLPALWREGQGITEKKTIRTIGFMGGPFRGKTFKSVVLPALYKVSEKRQLRLILPCDKEKENEVCVLGNERLEIVPFIRTSNYELLLNSYIALGTDILIHCGENIENNVYKTKNALLNASTLGASLIVSDIEPYRNLSDGSEGCYIITENTVDGWCNAFESLLDHPEMCNSIVRKAHDFCESHYDNAHVWANLYNILTKTPAFSINKVLFHYEILEEWFIHRAMMSIAGKQRTFVPDELCFSGELKKSRRYGFTTQTSEVSEVGLLFAVFGECDGKIRLDFYKRGNKAPVCTTMMEMRDIQENNYTWFLLSEPIQTEKNEKLYVEISLLYEKKDGWIGVFEDKKRRTFIYKVFNKLNCPLPGKDALYIDCRS